MLKLTRNTVEGMLAAGYDKRTTALRTTLHIGKIQVCFVSATNTEAKIAIHYGIKGFRPSVYTVKRNESAILTIGKKEIELGIDKCYPNTVKLFIDAPKSVDVRRADFV